MNGRLIARLAAFVLAAGTSLAARAQAPNPATDAAATTTVAVRVAVIAGPDFIRGAVRMRGAGGLPRGVTRDASAPAAVVMSPLDGAGSAVFTLSGEVGQSLSVILPRTIELSRLDGSQTVTVAMQSDLSGDFGAQQLARGPDGRGVLSFIVRGLILSKDARAGVYRGVWTVTTQYN